MYAQKYSIDEIAYFTGTTLENVAKIITYEDICNSINSNSYTRTRFQKNHPFLELFNEGIY
jgi:hypothetical protein